MAGMLHRISNSFCLRDEGPSPEKRRNRKSGWEGSHERGFPAGECPPGPGGGCCAQVRNPNFEKIFAPILARLDSRVVLARPLLHLRELIPTCRSPLKIKSQIDWQWTAPSHVALTALLDRGPEGAF
jgi:hypothetical protein